MTETLARRGITLAAAISSLVGPCGALLTETGNLDNAPLSPLWFLVIIPAFGVAIGLFSIYKGAKVAGVICLLTNGAALAFFGLIVAFFSRWH